MNSITGRGWAFPPQLNDRNRFSMVQDDLEIRQAIYIIINTVPGERVMRPDFGCEIHNLIFWPCNQQTFAIAERYVAEALGRWEPRMIVDEIKVSSPAPDRGELIIEVKYHTKEQHDPRSLVYPFYLIPGDNKEQK